MKLVLGERVEAWSIVILVERRDADVALVTPKALAILAPENIVGEATSGVFQFESGPVRALAAHFDSDHKCTETLFKTA